MMNEVRLFLTYIILFVAWMVCPKGARYHIKTAADFIDEDFIANEYAAVRKRMEREEF